MTLLPFLRCRGCGKLHIVDLVARFVCLCGHKVNGWDEAGTKDAGVPDFVTKKGNH